jgi:hypothetical protein
LVEAPLKDAITKGLNSDGATNDLNDVLIAAYNIKDPQATKWSMVAGTLTLASGAFNFTAQRDTP